MNRTSNNYVSRTLLLIVQRKTIISFGLMILILLTLSFGFLSTRVTAEKSSLRQKVVTSVKIEKGDSLWSIARQYITDEYKDINSFINEIKRSNGLKSDTIHEGCYIVVPYYTARQ